MQPGGRRYVYSRKKKGDGTEKPRSGQNAPMLRRERRNAPTGYETDRGWGRVRCVLYKKRMSLSLFLSLFLFFSPSIMKVEG